MVPAKSTPVSVNGVASATRMSGRSGVGWGFNGTPSNFLQMMYCLMILFVLINSLAEPNNFPLKLLACRALHCVSLCDEHLLSSGLQSSSSKATKHYSWLEGLYCSIFLYILGCQGHLGTIQTAWFLAGVITEISLSGT